MGDDTTTTMTTPPAAAAAAAGSNDTSSLMQPPPARTTAARARSPEGPAEVAAQARALDTQWHALYRQLDQLAPAALARDNPAVAEALQETRLALSRLGHALSEATARRRAAATTTREAGLALLAEIRREAPGLVRSWEEDFGYRLPDAPGAWLGLLADEIRALEDDIATAAAAKTAATGQPTAAAGAEQLPRWQAWAERLRALGYVEEGVWENL